MEQWVDNAIRLDQSTKEKDVENRLKKKKFRMKHRVHGELSGERSYYEPQEKYENFTFKTGNVSYNANSKHMNQHDSALISSESYWGRSHNANNRFNVLASKVGDVGRNINKLLKKEQKQIARNNKKEYKYFKYQQKKLKKLEKEQAKQAKILRNREYDRMIDEHLDVRYPFFRDKAEMELVNKRAHYSNKDIAILADRMIADRKKQLKKQYKKYYK